MQRSLRWLMLGSRAIVSGGFQARRRLWRTRDLNGLGSALGKLDKFMVASATFGVGCAMVSLSGQPYVLCLSELKDDIANKKIKTDKEEKKEEEKEEKKDGDESTDKSKKKKKKEKEVNYEKPEIELMKGGRILVLNGTINDSSANSLILRILLLDQVASEPIHLYITSDGGRVTSGFAIYDVMQSVKSPVYTYVVGHASSMAALIAAAGEPGYRTGYENSRIMVHEVSNGTSRKKVSDMVLTTEETVYLNEELLKLFAVHTKKDMQFLRENVRRDNYMSVEEAIEFGILDKIIKTTSKLD